MASHRALVALAFVAASCHPPQSPRPEPLPPAPPAPAPAGPPTKPAQLKPTPPPPVDDVKLDALSEGAHVHGFTATALYLDDAGKPIGARFVHDATHFTLDYLRIESAPQGFIWVNTFPTSDKGEPHTQEHLLLGKGARGRRLGSFEAMALAESSAFTAQWRTAYHFHTVAAPDEFWPVFENQLDAALNPDYTDEEIRREVRNFGVDKADGDKTTLRLEEKGTVYNEMVRTYEQPDVVAWREAGQLVYGPKHPLALDSGGFPEAIRTMTPTDIRTFHDATYHLANMGMVGAFPSAMPVASVLVHTGEILGKEAGRTGKVSTEADLPKPAPAAAGTLRVVEYPAADATSPGPIMLVWPAVRALDPTERTLLALFLDAFAGDESTPLYKKLIDRKTRVIDLGANAVWSNTSTDEGQPVYVGANGVKAAMLDAKTLERVRALVQAELQRIAKLPDGDPEVVALDARVQSRVVDLRRKLAKLLDTPPGFGFRGTSSEWLDHLHQLSKTKGFAKSLTMKDELAAIDKIVGAGGGQAAKTNPWRERIKAWGLLDKPFGVASRPSPALRAKLDAERKQRNDAELARLAKQYGTKDPQATLAAYAKDYDAETAKLEASSKATPLPPLVASPPMTLDDGLKYETGEIANVRSLVATFDSMTSARVELAFDVVGAVAPDDQFILAALPELLTDAGVIEDGKPIAADVMRERIRREILELSARYATNLRTHRVELVVAGAGNGAGETRAALAWIKRVLLAPDWRVENLPRLRDVVDRQIVALRQRMQGAEEGWVDDPRDAWWQQRSLEYLHAASFLTQLHDLHRLRWMLADPRDAKITAELRRFLDALAQRGKDPRAQLVTAAGELARGKLAAMSWLSKPANAIAREAGKDLEAALADIPDDALAHDWEYLCKEMAHDLELGAPALLGKLAAVRAQIVEHARARLVEVGSSANQQALAGDVEALARAIPAQQKQQGFGYGSTTPPLVTRVQERGGGPTKPPMFVGLADPDTSSGVFLDLAPAPSYSASDEASLLDYLTSNLFTGHGAHSIFMKTWAAGLAYSNGLHPRPAIGVIDYYAERCPLLPQTLRFVVDELRRAKPDANIARYAIAIAFSSRIASGYEARANAMAADLVDGLTPDVVRAFRSHLLELANRADLAPSLFSRMEKVYGKVLPGYGPLASDGIYFVIGPEKQLAAYEEYLRAAVGKDTRLVRLYPRDFWVPAQL